MKMPIATTIGEVYAYVDSPAAAVRFYEGTGFTHLDFSFYRMFHPGDTLVTPAWRAMVEDAGNAAAALGFDFVQAHAPGYNFRAPGQSQEEKDAGFLSIARSVEACGLLGIRRLVIHTGISAEDPYPIARDRYFADNKAYLQPLFPLLEKYGVTLCLENSAEGNMGHCYFPLWAQELNELIAYFDHPLVSGCWDVGHCNMRGVSLYDEMMALGKNMAAVHIHDNDGKRDLHQALFTGTLDVDGMMRAIRDSGFAGPFTLEQDFFLARVARQDGPLKMLPAPAKKAALRLMYETARACLDAYGL